MPGPSGEADRVEVIEHDLHGNALDDLYEVAGRVLRRQHGKALAGAALDRLDMACEPTCRIAVDLHVHGLTHAHPGQLGLLEVGRDSEPVGHDGHQLRAGLCVITDRHRPVRDVPVDRGHDPCIGDLKLRLGDLRLGQLQLGLA